MQEKLGTLPQEYLVLDTHQVSEAVKTGIDRGTGYHMALLDPYFSEFENVDDDVRLVEIQKRYACGCLRHQAILDAIEMVIGEARFDGLRPKLLRPKGREPARLVYEIGLHTRWASVGGDWARHGQRAIDTTASPDPLDDEVAEYLRRRTLVLLDEPDGPMPPMASRADAGAPDCFGKGYGERSVSWPFILALLVLVAVAASVVAYGYRHRAQDFSIRFATPGDVTTVQGQLLALLTPGLIKMGYGLATHAPTALIFTRRVHPAWTFVVAVFFFPIGLLFLFITNTQSLTVVLEQDRQHIVEVSASGCDDRAVARWLELSLRPED